MSGEQLRVDAVTHRYGGTAALRDVTLALRPGEFVTLLGPSGCGKTTLLRIVAGFVQPSSGRVWIGGRDVTGVPAHRRPVNTVFQRPTLFPHLDVAENVAFGLRLDRVRGEEIERRVAEALALVRLDGYQQRRSHELSGGQMQRVALARALVKRPSLLLLDEPLSALDLAIRLEMEAELRRLHREIGGTFVYVTHDQREALALSDRIVVFNRGRIEQLGTPDQIYRAPASVFAARFVGDANVAAVDVTRGNGGSATVAIGEHRFAVPGAPPEGPAWLVLRPEVVRVVKRTGVSTGLAGTVCDCAFRGAGFAYRVAVPGLPEPLKAEVAAGMAPPLAVGCEVALTWDGASCALLPR
jgi:ABC-type Fe3+/spermidine/putrescine transport system ATPase subunit